MYSCPVCHPKRLTEEEWDGEQRLEGEENRKVGEEVSLWSDGGVIRDHVCTNLYILIGIIYRHRVIPLASVPRCFNNSCCFVPLYSPPTIYIHLLV